MEVAAGLLAVKLAVYGSYLLNPGTPLQMLQL